MKSNVVPLLTRAARRAVVAPDLERYLDPANIDLMVTDQVQAVRVRVDRGLEVFETRLLEGRRAIRRSLLVDSAALLGCVVVAALTLEATPPLAAGVAGAGALWCLWSLTRSTLDARRLRRASSRVRRSDLDRLETSRQLLDHGEAVLDEARTLGAVPFTGEGET